jgi:hypothetical protein
MEEPTRDVASKRVLEQIERAAVENPGPDGPKGRGKR